MTETRFGSRPMALVGIAGSGKSAVARPLAAWLDGACISLDAQIEAAAGRSIAELFAGEGEAAFRAREVAALAAAIDEAPALIDCGGGVVLDPRNRALLRERCHTVWLEVPAAEALGRMGAQATARPLLANADALAVLEHQLEVRSPFYEEVAMWRIPTGGCSVEQVAGDIVRRIEEAR